MGSVNISIGFSDESKERNFTYKDYDISFKKLNNSLADLTDLQSIQNGLKNIFEWELGQRIILPNFGNSLKRFLYEPVTDKLLSAIDSEARALIERWEPRVIIENVEVQYNDKLDAHAIYIVVEYTIPTLDNGSLTEAFVISQ